MIIEWKRERGYVTVCRPIVDVCSVDNYGSSKQPSSSSHNTTSYIYILVHIYERERVGGGGD